MKVEEKKKKIAVLCASPPQNVKLGTFTTWSCCDSKKHDARVKLLSCQSKPFS